MKKAQIAYRGNDLLDKDVPVIARALEEVGYEVRMQRFEPSSGDKSETVFGPSYPKARPFVIWAQQNLEYLTECDLVLSDQTFQCALRNGRKPKEPSIEDKLKFPLESDLDIVIDNILFKVVTGRETVDSELSIEETKQAYLSVLSRMQLPNKIYVAEDLMAAHEPFVTREDHGSKEACAKSAQTLASWFREAGASDVRVMRYGDLLNLPEEDKNQGNWVVTDRHTRQYEPINGFTIIQTPLGSFWQDVNKHGLIQGVDYSEELAEYIKQRFGGESK